MLGNYASIIGFIAVAIGIVGYIPYYWDIFRGTTKPHPFTWFGFSLLNAISFFAQIAKGGGPGAWTTATSAIFIMGIALLSLRGGKKDITRIDMVCFVGTILSVVAWVFTKEPLTAVVIITIADLLAFLPTFRKGYLRPQEETATLYFLSTVKYGLSVVALSSLNLTTALFPAVIAALNGAFVVMIAYRRRQLKVL